MGHNTIKGIYLIERTNEQPGDERKYYIGQSNDLGKRFTQHFTGNEQEIDKAIQKYGVSSFIFTILEEVKSGGSKRRDEREKYWITEYIQKYGRKLLFNRETGGTVGKEPINRDRKDEIEQQIRSLFTETEKSIGRNIYLLANKFGISCDKIIDIREPLLTQYNLKWNIKLRKITYIGTDIQPEWWNGGTLTNEQYRYVVAHIPDGDKQLNKQLAKQLAEQFVESLNIKKSDIQSFLKEWNNGENNYVCAEEKEKLLNLKI